MSTSVVTSGLGAMADVALLIGLPLFSPSRWRRPAGADAYGEQGLIAATTGTSPTSTGLIADLDSGTWEPPTSENPKLGDPGSQGRRTSGF
jgi:hypothetical protein